MIPRGAEAIGHLATRVAMDLMPKATEAYAAQDLGYMVLLLSMIGQDFERAADVLLTDIAEMSDIFRDARQHVVNLQLARRMADCIAAEPKSLKISDLNARADSDLKVLIDLHEAVERAVEQGQAWAEPVEEDIWDFLDGYARRRAYQVSF